jgi:hypothetical protein
MLASNGGPTQTVALLSSSPALDAGDDSVLAPPLSLSTDQRGLARRSGSHVDIGAYELQVTNPPAAATTTNQSAAPNAAGQASPSGTAKLKKASLRRHRVLHRVRRAAGAVRQQQAVAVGRGPSASVSGS